MKTLEFQLIDELDDLERGWNQLFFESLDPYLFSKNARHTLWRMHFRKGKEMTTFTSESEGLLFPVECSTIKFISSKRCKAELVAGKAADYQAFSIDQVLSPLLLEGVLKTNE